MPRSRLVLSVPSGRVGWFRQKFGYAAVHGPEAGLSPDWTARVVIAWVPLRPGMSETLALGRKAQRGG